MNVSSDSSSPSRRPNGHHRELLPASMALPPADLDDRPNVEVSHAARRGVRLAQGLGWLSVGLGLAELLAPRAVGRLIGVRDAGLGLRLCGAREVLTGVALLTGRRAAWWTGGRLIGDVVDLALLGAALADPTSQRRRVSLAAAAVAGLAAVDAVATRALAGAPDRQDQVARVTHVGRAVTIDASAHELYGFWRELRNLPKVMPHVRIVEEAGGRARWVADGPGGVEVGWTSELVADEVDRRIAWRTFDGAFVSSGAIRFCPAPGARGTEVIIDMHYTLPAGTAGKAVAALSGRAPGLELARALARFKQLIEIGEVVRSDASIHRGPHPARPAWPHELERPRARGELS